MTSSNSHATSDFGLVLRPLAAVLVGSLLGPLGLAAVAVPWVTAWYVATPSICLLFLAVSAVLTGQSLVSGHLVPAIAIAWSALQDPTPGVHLETVLAAWLRLSLDQRVTSGVLPLGVLLGAITRLLSQDAQNSGLGRLLRSKPRRGVGVKSASARMSRRASSKGDRTLLGVGWTNGVPVYISDAELANHVMVVGTTGRGKTVTTLNLVEAHMSRHSG